MIAELLDRRTDLPFTDLLRIIFNFYRTLSIAGRDLPDARQLILDAFDAHGTTGAVHVAYVKG